MFIGVYAAFALSEYQERREASDRRTQLRAALVREISGITANTRPVARTAPAEVALFDSLVSAGQRPALIPMIQPIGVEAHMWASALESGGLELLDVATIYRLSAFYNELNAGFAQIEQLRRLSETVLIPNLGLGSEEFYDARTGGLNPKYGWYRDGLVRLGGLAQRITALGDSLLAELSP